MRRYLLDGAQQAAPGPAPAAAPAAAASSGLGPAPSPAPASTQPGSGAAMGMAVSRTVLYCGIGAATLVWLVALVIIVRSCMRWRRNAETNGGSQGTQGAAAADKPRKRVFAAPLPVLIIQPDRRSFELGFQEGEGWHSLVTQPCPAAQHDKQPGPGSSAAGTGQFVVEFAEAGVWLPADDPRGTEAAGNPSSSTHSGSDR